MVLDERRFNDHSTHKRTVCLPVCLSFHLRRFPFVHQTLFKGQHASQITVCIQTGHSIFLWINNQSQHSAVQLMVKFNASCPPGIFLLPLSLHHRQFTSSANLRSWWWWTLCISYSSKRTYGSDTRIKYYIKVRRDRWAYTSIHIHASGDVTLVRLP